MRAKLELTYTVYIYDFWQISKRNAKGGQKSLKYWGTLESSMLSGNKTVSSYFGSPLAEYYCIESNNSDITWLIHLFSSYSIKIWLSKWRHRLANLHILKHWIISGTKKGFLKIVKTAFFPDTDFLMCFVLA